MVVVFVVVLWLFSLWLFSLWCVVMVYVAVVVTIVVVVLLLVFCATVGGGAVVVVAAAADILCICSFLKTAFLSSLHGRFRGQSTQIGTCNNLFSIPAPPLMRGSIAS